MQFSRLRPIYSALAVRLIVRDRQRTRGVASRVESATPVRLQSGHKPVSGSRKFYWMGCCVGRGSVVGLGTGSTTAVSVDGVGVTVCTDGPALVVSPTRSVVVRGYISAISATAIAAAAISGNMLLRPYGVDR